MNNDFAAMWQQLMKRMGDLSPVMSEIGEVIATSIQKNFRLGGRFGNDNEFGGGKQKWSTSQRARQQSGQTLVDTGILMKSITYRATGNALVVGTNIEYAAIHNFGGYAGRDRKVYSPARPFMVIQNEDIAEIEETLIPYYVGLFG